MTDTPDTPRKRGKAVAGAVALVVVLVAAAVAANVASDDNGNGEGATPTTGASTGAGKCARPAVLTAPPEVDASGTGAWKKVKPSSAPVCFSLIAQAADAAGIDNATAFILTGDISASEAEERLVVDPPFPFTVQEAEKGRLRVSPAGPMAESAVYRFTLLDAPGGATVGRWSFETKGRLSVVQTLPSDKATNVPLDTGIEVTFSHDDVTAGDDLLKITPEVEGRTERHHRTLVFVPKALAPETLYTVTLKAGAAIPGSDQKLSQDKTFRFETGSAGPDLNGGIHPFITFTRDVWEAATADPPVVGLVDYSDGGVGGTPAGDGAAAPRKQSFDVYRFAKIDDFLASMNGVARLPIWSVYTRGRYTAPLDGLDKVATFETTLEKGGPGGELFARFPEKLPEGWYLVTTTASRADRQAQAWLQVTDLAPYAAVSETRTVVWVNDLATKKASGGTAVRVAGAEGAPAGTTDEDGVVLFDTPKGLLRTTEGALGVEAERAGNLIVGRPNGPQAVIPLAITLSGASTFSFRENEFYGDPGRFWRAMQSDRTLYRTTDTVNVWGMIRPRAGALGPDDVTVDVVGYTEGGGETVVARTQVSRSPSGTFITKLPISGADPGYYTLRAGIGDEEIATNTIEVRDFVKPGYRLDVTPSKRAVIRGDEVTYDVTASFFEGTPVPGARLQVATDDRPGPAVTTDAAGQASVTEKLDQEVYGSGYSYDTFNIRPASPEEGEITGGAEVRIFPASLLVDGEAVRRGDEGVSSGRVFGVDLVKANGPERSNGRGGAGETPTGGGLDYEGPPAVGVEVKAEIVETSYQKIETGDYYNFIAKEVRKSYRYEEVEGPPTVRTATTDAQGRYELTFPAPADRTFRIKVSITDAQGRPADVSQYLSSGLVYPDFTQLSTDDYGSQRVGDKVTAELTLGADPVPSGGDNRFLFVKAQQGIRSANVISDPSFSFTFGDGDVPSVSILGVRFTGTTYDVPSEPLTVFFDEQTRALNVSVDAARPRYAPGDKAELKVKVTDAAGKPAADAEVLLSAIDERVYALSQSSYLGQTDVLTDLYRPVASGLLGGYASHIFPGTGPNGTGAEAGEGGDDRSDFRDAVLFKTVRTDADGAAAASFDLPDDLTSWRVAGVAVTDDLRAGTGLTLVPVGLPLFADLGMAESYLVDDQPVLRVRAFGDALKAGDPVTFTVTAAGLLDAPIKLTGEAFEPVGVPVPKLTEGTHPINVKVEGAGKTDSLTRPMTVLRSRLTGVETTLKELASGKKWAPSPAAPGGPPVRELVLTDHNRGRFYPDLVDLAWTYGQRVDQALARDLAGKLLDKYFGPGAGGLPSVSTFRGSPYQAEGGGITVLPFSDQDLIVSARVAALAPDRFGRQGLVRYFTSVLDDPETPADRAFIALYGLAAAGEPVLDEVQRNAKAENLTPTARLLTGLSATALGDEATGRAMYRSVLSEAGEERAEAVRVSLATPEETSLATALAAVLGAQVGDALAPRLEGWAIANPPRDDLVVLERISFLAAALPRVPDDPVTFSYVIGAKVDEKLELGESKVIRVTDDEIDKLNLTVKSGTLGIAERTFVPVDPATLKTDPALGIGRKLPATVGANDLVRVELTPRGPGKAGCNQVTDLLPSGLRAVSEPYRYGREGDKADWPYSIEGQRVSFCSYGARPIIYLARVVSAGSYAAEPALIRSGRDPAAVALSPAARLEIK